MDASAPKIPGPGTEADLLALPEEGRGFELLDGEIVEKRSGYRHSFAHFVIGGCLAPYRRRVSDDGGPGGWRFLMEQLVRFESGQTLRPDVAGWHRERLPTPPRDDETVITVRPDWICEIISSSNAGNDLVKKRRIYYRHQVPHYWILDPRDQILTVLRWTPDGYIEALVASRSERVRPEPFGAVEWLVGELFDDEEDDGQPAP